MTHLVLSLLGPFQATLDGALVTAFESDKVRALLAYLAVESGRPQRRETLAGLLWPDMAERAARTNLRHVLANLRTVINDRDTEQPFLLASRQTIQFNAESDFRLDVRAFTDAIAATITHQHTTLEACETCIARLRDAAKLYNGDFLAGFSLDSDLFEEWVTVQREKLHIQALDVLDHLSIYQEQCGDHAEVLRYAQRQVELEPWRESAHRQWMCALAHSGQRGMALAQYEACRRILDAELGIEPEAATTALYEQIRRGDLRPQTKPADTQFIPSPAISVTPPLPLAPTPIAPTPSAPTALLEGERRVVTLLLADVRGTGTLSPHSDLEAWAELVTPALHLLGAEIIRLGGNVEHYRRAGLTACFGGQIAHEDDPERAVLAALAMREALIAYLKENTATDLCLTVSVHTGEVILTAAGDAVSMMGDVLDHAERTQAVLTPGVTWVSDATHRLIAPLFTWAPRDGDGHQPVAHRQQAGKGRGIAGLSSPLVGRDAELHALQEAVERLQAGIGGIVTLVGEAGIGKSRLVTELKLKVTSQKSKVNGLATNSGLSTSGFGLNWIEGRCLSYATGSAYQMWRDTLHVWLDASADAAPDVVIDTLQQRVRILCPDAFNDIYPFLAWLLSLPLDVVAMTRLRGIDAEGLQVLTFRAVTALLDCAAQQAPLVLVCEDLHWADATSLALLEHLLALTDRVPLLFVCIFRPEREHGCWHIREVAARTYEHHHTDVQLKALSLAESAQLVGNLLASDTLPQELRRRIFDLAEGNPFYVEEILRSLVDDAIVVYDEAAGCWHVVQKMDERTLPDTLYGVLMARIDRLPVGAKRVLQLASVIGRIFSYPLLAAVAERTNLDVYLVTLQRAGMIRERARLPEQEFIFHHQFTLEAAYGGLLRRARRVLHRRVAGALETLYPERIEENLGLLAHHWEQAEDTERAVVYLRRAGEQAAARYANTEAVDYLSRALILLPETEAAGRYAVLIAREAVYDLQGARNTQEQDLAVLAELAAWLDTNHPQVGYSRQADMALRQARYAIRVGQYSAALAAAQQATQWAQTMQDIAAEASGHREWGRALQHLTNLPAALVQLEQALALSRQAHLPQVEIETLHSMGRLYSAWDNQAKAQSYWEQELHRCQETHIRHSEGEAKRDVGVALEAQMKMEEALSYFEQSLAICRAMGDRRNEGWALLFLGSNYFKRGHYVEVGAYYEQAVALFREIKDVGGLTYAVDLLVELALEQEQYKEFYLEQALQCSREASDRTGEGQCLGNIGDALQSQGHYVEAQYYLEQALHIFCETGIRLYEGWIRRDIGSLYFLQGDYTRAITLTEESIHIARTIQDANQEKWGLILRGFIFHQQGNDEMAEQYGQQVLRNVQLVKYNFPRVLLQSLAWCLLGHIAANLCHMEEAIQAYTQSLEQLQTLSATATFIRDRATESQAGLARVALAQEDTPLALTYVEQILDYLYEQPLLGETFEPFRIYLTCYQVLQTAADPRAPDVLRAAYTMLQERAANIEDESLRHSYLENVPYHREIVAEWKRAHPDDQNTTSGSEAKIQSA